MATEPLPIDKLNQIQKITNLRPGHADYAGAIKYNQSDLRNILERSSARETAMRVAAGAVAKIILKQLNIEIFSHVTNIGGFTSPVNVNTNILELKQLSENSPVRCIDQSSSEKMVKRIDKAIEEGVSLGGGFEVIVTGLPVGIGSHVQWDRKLDGNLAKAVMSIQAIKSVEIGLGHGVEYLDGSKVHDEIFYENEKIMRKTNNAGGIEGGMSNGEPIIIKASMKPIPTMKNALESIDFQTKTAHKAHFERADVCAVPAAGVVTEAVVAIEIINAILEKFGGDSMEELKERVR